ncbi:hypothetical protein L2E82_30233 [Cichorium intybus]|uniref:Uncharacterized protein n=1 Tax=Cichorium intybus TaxID=13427 RepID=A0ACB9D027_CICIN|nr:hypothetical protein L2E82_30233 [Cichorium intybus]
MYVILKVEIFHQVNNLVDTLDESMLLQLTVLWADVLSDVTGKEMAEIEALVEEAAEVVDTSHQKNPNYYRCCGSFQEIHILLRQGVSVDKI